MRKRASMSSIPKSSATPDAMVFGLGSAAAAPVHADVRLSGKVLKRNAGFLRQWRARAMVVTSDGFLRYDKRKGDNTRTKETDLLKSQISPNLVLNGNNYCIEIQCDQSQFVLGFPSKSEARLWQEVMLEVADSNAAGRRAWVAQLRRVLTLNLRERREAVERMGDRDWLTEWNYCWKSMNKGREEDFNGRRRRLKRLYTIWLQFQLFAEVVAEIHLATAQSRDMGRTPLSRDNPARKSESDVSEARSNYSSTSGKDSSSSSVSKGWAVSWSSNGLSDVDFVEMKSMKIEYGSKSWRGEKRLKKEVADFARFRQTLESLVSMHGMQDAMAKFPSFPLMAAFSIRGVQVVANALPLNVEVEMIQVDRRDISELTGGLRLKGGLSRFLFGEFPELWVRRVRGTQEGELVRVASKYDDVLRYSLRSNLVHGVLLRAGEGHIQVLSAHDVGELVQGVAPRWTPYLDLLYYQVGSSDGTTNNHPARQFLLKRPKSESCNGDVVIAVDASVNRLQLNLKEGFIKKYQVEILPILRRLQDVKSTNAQMINNHKGGDSSVVDPAAAIVDDLELTIKRLLRRHVREVACKLVTLGDDVAPSVNNQPGRLSRTASAAFSRQYSVDHNGGSLSFGDPPRRQSSMSNLATGGQRSGSAANSLYVIDGIHLRRLLKRQGVNTNLFPLAFSYIDPLHQPGVQLLLASDIVARIARTLFHFRLSHDQNAEKSRWRSRKSRLIEFINLIMGGLHADEGASQFWDVDAPIWFLLGPFASSIALSDQPVINPQGTLQKFRQIIKTNPPALFNNLLRVFGAHLTDGYLPALDETRWVSLQFIQREGQLSFFDEAVDPKLAITYHPVWLTATVQSFRLYFENLQRMFVEGGGSITSKSEIQSSKVFFDALTSQFRHSIACSSETRVENAILALDVQQGACHSVVGAHKALQAYQLDTARDLVRQACESIGASGAQSSFPLELKITLLSLAALSDREAGPLSPSKKGTAALVQKWSTISSWLHHFYRASNYSQAMPSLCPHPLSEAIRLLVGSSRARGFSTSTDDSPTSPRSSSFRSKIERGAELDVWGIASPIVERQFYLATSSYAAARSNGRAGGYPNSNSMSSQGGSLHATDVQRKSSPDPSSTVGQSANGTQHAMELAGSLEGSSWDRLLRTLEQLVMPYIWDTKGSWLLPGYLFESAAVEQARFPPRVNNDTVPAPGMTFIWGRSTGLSLDDESKLSTTKIDGIAARPRNHNDVSIVEIPLPVRRVMQVSCGYRHTAFITGGDQRLYTFGYGECGRLGHGDERSVETPKRVEFFASLADNLGGPAVAGVHNVACGREHTMVVLVNGELYGFGWAEAGRIGTGESGSVVNPSRVVSLKDVRAVACGREHTLALTETGAIYSFGAGFGGRLGNGGETDEETPVPVAGLDGEVVVQIDAGECHSAAMTREGSVYTWGFGSSGALGNGSQDNVYLPTVVNGPWVDSREGERITGIACGSYHTLAYSTHGRLYGWGDSAAGQLGDKLVDVANMVVLTPQQIKLPRTTTFQGETNSTQRIRSIACGTFTSAVSMTDGKLFLWGSPAAGNGATLDLEDAKVKQVNVLSEFSVGQIACGAYHSVALTADPIYN